MSETVTYKGKLHLECIGNEECEKFAESKFHGVELETYYDSWLDKLTDSDKYVKIGDKLYSVLQKEELSNEDIFEMKQNENGELEYIVQYYNGGCSFQEALEYAHKNIKITA